MRRSGWRACAAGLAVALAAGAAAGRQVPGAPAPAAAPAVAAAAAKPGFFQRACAVLDECRRKLCATPAGQLLGAATRPASALTGGVIPSFCPPGPSEKDLQRPGVSGTASAAQKDAMEAKQRRDAVRFLGTLDCRYYPDAATALAAALRTDGSECVRYEAALVLGRGCCCTEKTVKALDASVSGTEADGNPAERSVRVRCAAGAALERCLACYTPPAPDPPEDKTPKGGDRLPPDGPPVTPPEKGLSPATVGRARRTLDEFHALLAAGRPPEARPAPGSVPGRRSVYHLVKDAVTDAPTGVVPAGATIPAPADLAGSLSRQAVYAATAADRRAAIRELVRLDWREHPVVASALLLAAKGDADGANRAEALRHLAAGGMDHPQVLADVAALTTDPDRAVREEAGRTLARLRPTP